MARATFYVQLEAKLAGGPGRWHVRGLTFRRATSRYPRDPLPGTIVSELTIEIPDEALKPLAPKAIIELSVDDLDIVVRADPIATAS